MKRLLFIFSILSALLLTGCKVPQQEYNGFKIGEIYQTEVDAYVVFGYATFIWQNRRDWQEIGVLYSFPARLDDSDKEKLTLLKNKGFLEMKRCFDNSPGGMLYFLSKGLIYPAEFRGWALSQVSSRSGIRQARRSALLPSLHRSPNIRTQPQERGLSWHP